MKKSLFLLVLLSPLFAAAQHKDFYYVPVKEKKTIVANSALEDGLAGIDDVEYDSCNYEEYENNVDEVYYANDLYGYYDENDYQYSSRIVRFRNPARLLGSNLYWDLRYNCGINDWLIYDNGYTVDIYPTFNNPAYYWPGTAWSANDWYSWNSWSSWHYPYNWGCYDWGYYPGYHHGHHWYPAYGHIGHHPPHFAHNSWKPAHKVHADIPVNNNRHRGNRSDIAVNGSRNQRGTNGSASRVNNAVNKPNRQLPPRNSNRVSSGSTSSRDKNNDKATANRQQPRRDTNRVTSSQSGDRGRQGGAVRSQQPRRATSNANAGTGNVNRRGNGVRVRSTNERSSGSSSSGSSNRNSYRRSSSSSSSSGYNRPSSTSVSRSRSSSSSVSRSSSSSSSSGSSRSSSSGSSRSSSRR